MCLGCVVAGQGLCERANAKKEENSKKAKRTKRQAKPIKLTSKMIVMLPFSKGDTRNFRQRAVTIPWKFVMHSTKTVFLFSLVFHSFILRNVSFTRFFFRLLNFFFAWFYIQFQSVRSICGMHVKLMVFYLNPWGKFLSIQHCSHRMEDGGDNDYVDVDESGFEECTSLC